MGNYRHAHASVPNKRVERPKSRRSIFSLLTVCFLGISGSLATGFILLRLFSSATNDTVVTVIIGVLGIALGVPIFWKIACERAGRVARADCLDRFRNNDVYSEYDPDAGSESNADAAKILEWCKSPSYTGGDIQANHPKVD
jgi:hypothetical protein